MRRTISQQSPAGLIAEPVFGPLVAPPVLFMRGKESRIAEIEPEHIDRLVQVELLTQRAQIYKTPGHWHERVAVAGRSCQDGRIVVAISGCAAALACHPTRHRRSRALPAPRRRYRPLWS